MTHPFLTLTDTLICSHLALLAEATQAVTELEQQNIVLEQKVKQRNQEIETQGQHLSKTLIEMTQMRSHLLQMEKMSTLGQMLSGIAHEINNPINFIYGNLPYIEEYLEDLVRVLAAYQSSHEGTGATMQPVLEDVELDFVLEDLPRIVSSVKLGAERIRELVLTLRNFYRLNEAEMKFTDLHEGIENTLILLNHRYKQKIEIVRQFGNIPPIECHINQLNQVFMNLLGNAIDALEEPSRLILVESTGSSTNHSDSLVTTAKPQIRIKTEQLGENWVTVSITDNGPGVPLEIQNRLFDAFFTTKPMGVGTGLGLSISYQIISEIHQGRIYCCSAPGEGTTFKVELPIQQPSRP